MFFFLLGCSGDKLVIISVVVDKNCQIINARLNRSHGIFEIILDVLFNIRHRLIILYYNANNHVDYGRQRHYYAHNQNSAFNSTRRSKLTVVFHKNPSFNLSEFIKYAHLFHKYNIPHFSAKVNSFPKAAPHNYFRSITQQIFRQIVQKRRRNT